MIFYFEANLTKFAVHHVGNPLQDEYFSLSDETLEITDQVMNSLLMHYFLSPFQKSNEVYNFMHPSGNLQLNETYTICKDLFDGDSSLFLETSERLVKHLYAVSNHPKIKSGELYVVLFDNLQIEGELLSALGVFKSENKESYLKVNPSLGRIELSYEQNAINVNKLDKGCLIFNTGADEGYKVAVIDNGGKSSPGYWIDEFLQLRVRNDEYTATSQVMNLCKSFITEKLDNEFELSHSDKADLLNRTLKYFKEKEAFDEVEYTSEVLGNTVAAESFKQFKSAYEADYDTKFAQNFEISDSAVKKQQRIYKSVIKLDKNFQIYVTGHNAPIERGFDEDRSLNYYKVFFKNESL